MYDAPSKLVPVAGSRKLNLVCLGEGAPAVVFEAGASNTSSAWRAVQGRIALFTRACAYDRAGVGNSDPASRASDAANTVDDLYRLVRNAGIARPFVLVGHSAGGLYATLYADLHLRDLAGLILIDPPPVPYRPVFENSITPDERARSSANVEELIASLQACASGHPRSGFPALPAHVCSAEASEQRSLWGGPRDAEGVDDQQEQRASRPYGSLPVLVMTAGERGPSRVVAAEGMARWNAAVEAYHRRLAARSTAGRAVVVRSGHMIQLEQPDVVVEAVQQMVEAARRVPQS
jgi:pimeloyl-ACP methyl ester carboxylesterase